MCETASVEPRLVRGHTGVILAGVAKRSEALAAPLAVVSSRGHHGKDSSVRVWLSENLREFQSGH